MYDQIRLTSPYPFNSDKEREYFCQRFGLFNQNYNKGIYNNSGYKDLSQNMGMYMKLEDPSNNQRGKLTLSVSLHKLYNFHTGIGYQNYNDFDFFQANKTRKLLVQMFPMLDMSKIRVNEYEIGINVIASKSPELYFTELKGIENKGILKRIIEDRRIKEYHMYGTNASDRTRSVYVFYNKTAESKNCKYKNVPNNLIRIEKKNKRIENLYFDHLFDSFFQKEILKKLENEFVEYLSYKEYPKPNTGFRKNDFDLMELISENGQGEAINEIKNQLKTNLISKQTYYNRLKRIDELEKFPISSYFEISESARELKFLIAKKINELSQKSVRFSS